MGRIKEDFNPKGRPSNKNYPPGVVRELSMVDQIYSSKNLDERLENIKKWKDGNY